MRILAIALLLLVSCTITVPERPKTPNSDGYFGVVEYRCIEGYKFLIGSRTSSPTQILDSEGHGIPCE